MKLTPEQLSQLEDIALPIAPGFWPPSWGLIILFLSIFILFILIVVGVFMLKRIQNRQWKKETLALFNELKTQSQAAQDTSAQVTLLAELNQLLKRVSLTCYEQKTVSHLQGDAWLAFLDESNAAKNKSKNKSNQFRNGPGQILEYAPYQNKLNAKPLASQDWENLFKVCEHWLNKQAVRKGK